MSEPVPRLEENIPLRLRICYISDKNDISDCYSSHEDKDIDENYIHARNCKGEIQFDFNLIKLRDWNELICLGKLCLTFTVHVLEIDVCFICSMKIFKALAQLSRNKEKHQGDCQTSWYLIKCFGTQSQTCCIGKCDRARKSKEIHVLNNFLQQIVAIIYLNKICNIVIFFFKIFITSNCKNFYITTEKYIYCAGAATKLFDRY
jgi:hypothetical protein